MSDAIIKVIYVCLIVNLSVCLATAATAVDDDSSKNLTSRSINDAATTDDTPLRINLAGEYSQYTQMIGYCI